MQNTHRRMKRLIHVGVGWQQTVAQEWEQATMWVVVLTHAWIRNGLKQIAWMHKMAKSHKKLT